MKTFIYYFKGGISAGIIIGIFTTMYLVCPNKLVGAFLFSGGLLTICILGLTLFTGAIGYVIVKPKPVLPGLLGNITGMLVTAMLIRLYDPNIISISNKVLLATVEDGPLVNFISALFCGMLMFIAVHIYHHKSNVLGIVVAIPCFVICGFDHSIVNMYHWVMASSLEDFLLGGMVVGVSLMGNTLGAILMYIIFDGIPKKKERRTNG